MKIEFENVYYLKLGKEGIWEKNLKGSNKARIGWSDIDIQDIQKNNWSKIKQKVETDFFERNKKNGATQDFNALKTFCHATDKDVFITFSKGMLYWCILDNNEIQKDELSKFRTLSRNWQNTDIKGKELHINSISGKITKTQGYRATLCKIEEKDAIRRIINGEINPIAEQIQKKEMELRDLLVESFSDLYWKDCEILTDLIFIQSGWRRISLVGESMKFMDMELENSITKERYQVQVKNAAGKKEFEDYANEFSEQDYSKLFFVTFNPKLSLINYQNDFQNIQLLVGEKLAELIIHLGLTKWVIDKLT